MEAAQLKACDINGAHYWQLPLEVSPQFVQVLVKSLLVICNCLMSVNTEAKM